MSEQKVVINRQHGGFGLSDAAQIKLLGRCEHIRLMEPREYYGNVEGWEAQFAEQQARGTELFGVVVHEGKIVCDGHADSGARGCPHLVAVVEELGEAASGWAASLRVVAVPDGVEWAIEEYDGLEWVAETHRTWS